MVEQIVNGGPQCWSDTQPLNLQQQNAIHWRPNFIANNIKNLSMRMVIMGLDVATAAAVHCHNIINMWNEITIKSGRLVRNQFDVEW